MLLSKRNTTCAIIFIWVLVSSITMFCTGTSETGGYVSTHEYSAKEIKIPFSWLIGEKEQEISNVVVEDYQTIDNLHDIADDIKSISKTVESTEEIYEVPINTAPELKSGVISEGEYISINIDKLLVYVDAEYDSYDWDKKRRIKDIYILKEILVNQLNVAPTKAAAIIGNICCEDSFAGLTNSAASLENLKHAKSVLGNGGRGYGCVQWTASYRQRGLEDYYDVVNKDLDWELTSIIAETAYLYNELYVSGILGDLTEDGDLEHLTGIVACEYEAYANHPNEWSKSNGVYKTGGCQRYTYAKNVYELICSEVGGE